MDTLPEVVIKTILEFLLPEEMMSLSLTSKTLHGLLPRLFLIRGRDFERMGPSKFSHRPSVETYFHGPVLKTKVKSLKSSILWKDQGWGNQKGRIFVNLMRPNQPNQKEIATNKNLFGLADHDWKTSTCLLIDDDVVKSAEPGDYYSFMMDPGGDGGHRLFVKHFTVVLELE